jgi:hypothetical protein
VRMQRELDYFLEASGTADVCRHRCSRTVIFVGQDVLRVIRKKHFPPGPGNHRFLGIQAAPSCPNAHRKRWGLRPPPSPAAFGARRGRLDPPNQDQN